MTTEAEDVTALLEGARYRFARSSVGRNPHFYTLRKTWQDLDQFFHCVRYIREHGREELYWGAHTPAPGNPPYLKLRIEPFVYWTMGWPIEETELINRAYLRDDPNSPEYVPPTAWLVANMDEYKGAFGTRRAVVKHFAATRTRKLQKGAYELVGTLDNPKALTGLIAFRADDAEAIRVLELEWVVREAILKGDCLWLNQT